MGSSIYFGASMERTKNEVRLGGGEGGGSDVASLVRVCKIKIGIHIYEVIVSIVSQHRSQMLFWRGLLKTLFWVSVDSGVS